MAFIGRILGERKELSQYAYPKAMPEFDSDDEIANFINTYGRNRNRMVVPGPDMHRTIVIDTQTREWWYTDETLENMAAEIWASYQAGEEGYLHRTPESLEEERAEINEARQMFGLPSV